MIRTAFDGSGFARGELLYTSLHSNIIFFGIQPILFMGKK
jgi:hypothetical protein